MNLDTQIKDIFDGLRKIAFFAGHGKYNELMPLEEVNKIKTVVEQILEMEKEYEQTTTQEQKEIIYEKLEKYTTYTIRDFLEHK